jgi:lactoylglutathione lyase
VGPAMHDDLVTTNTILYCREWEATTSFYRDGFGLPVNLATEWFVEFVLTPTSRLSIADERRASIKSCGGGGVTVALQVGDVDAARRLAVERGMNPTETRVHAWGARVFYVFDPEGHRIEVWQPETTG